MLTRNLQIGLPLPIHDATLLHAAGIDTKLQWSVTNLAGRDLDEGLDAQLEEMATKLRTDVVEGRAPAKLQAFVDQSQEVFLELLKPEVDLDKIIPGKSFQFVIGAPRTGGTYFVSELFKAAGLDHTNFNKLMVHDGIPDTNDLILSPHPLRNMAALFQMAQFLVWAREAFADSPVVIKKKIYFSFWTSQLARLFGDKATYYVTVRHPVPMIVSFFETLGRLDQVSPQLMESALLDHHYDTVSEFNRITSKRWRQLNAFEKMLHLWESYYTAIASACATKGRIVPLAMGAPMHDFLRGLTPPVSPLPNTVRSSATMENIYIFSKFPRTKSRSASHASPPCGGPTDWRCRNCLSNRCAWKRGPARLRHHL